MRIGKAHLASPHRQTYLVAPRDRIYTPPPKNPGQTRWKSQFDLKFWHRAQDVCDPLCRSNRIEVSVWICLPLQSPMFADPFERQFRMRTGSARRCRNSSVRSSRNCVVCDCDQMVSFAENSPVAEEITFSRPDMDTSIVVSADSITRWQAGSYEILHLAAE